MEVKVKQDDFLSHKMMIKMAMAVVVLLVVMVMRIEFWLIFTGTM
jgi:hypothetical protein